MELVIVESSTKAKTIENYLNSSGSVTKYVVMACNGHICDLEKEKNTFGVDKETLLPKYSLIPGKEKIVRELTKAAKTANMVWLAADNDREGEAIAWHLKEYLKLKVNKYHRIVFNEITKKAIFEAMMNPTSINECLVNAQKARRVLDRVVGFSLTKQLYRNFTSNNVLSAGRVQSAVLLLVVQKEESIRHHVPKQYWNIIGSFDIGVTDTKLYHKNVVFKSDSKEFIENIFNTFFNLNYKVDKKDTKIKQVKEYPDPPFTTSTLQQRAFSEIGFSINKTMKLSQDLYEKGHITYMRTDSTNLSIDSVNAIHNFIGKKYNIGFVNNTNTVKKGQRNPHGAHEAIRPTNIDVSVPKNISEDQNKLYTLIHRRTISSQMIPALYDEIHVKISSPTLDEKEMFFFGKSRMLVSHGFKIVYGVSNDKHTFKQVLADICGKKHVRLTKAVGNNVWTSPPQRFNEALLIHELESIGVGRPSTYVSILSKLYERKYIEKLNKSGPVCEYVDIIQEKDKKLKYEIFSKELYVEKSKIVPSESGYDVTSFLTKSFGEIVDITFTSKMEADLDRIASNERDYMSLIQPFMGFLSNKVKDCEKKEKTELTKKQRVVSINKIDYIVRDAKYGPVIEICGDTRKFVGLAPYMEACKKTVDDIDESDISLLVMLPLEIKGYCVKYARYGFFVTDQKTNKSLNIYPKFIKDMLKRDFSFIDKMFTDPPKKKYRNKTLK